MRITRPSITECELPAASTLDRRWVDAAWFRDSWRAPLSRTTDSVVDIFFGIFAHHPLWMKVALIVRNRIAAWCGLDAPKAADILHVDIKRRYAVGDTLGVWPLYTLTDTELVAGRDDKHLDFRFSLLKESGGDTASVVVSTVCVVHNVFGKVYLFFVVPFHRWGVRRLLSRAISAGRL